jgi:hypothetical protein
VVIAGGSRKQPPNDNFAPNLKHDALAVQYLGVRSRLLSLFRALMVIRPRVTKHRFDDVWMIKV